MGRELRPARYSGDIKSRGEYAIFHTLYHTNTYNRSSVLSIKNLKEIKEKSRKSERKEGDAKDKKVE